MGDTDMAVIDANFVELTPRERSVVENWMGSGKETWKCLQLLNGDEFSQSFVRDCLLDIRVVRAIRLYEGRSQAGVLTKQERQQFWSSVILDDNQRMGDRLKASELLGKVGMDFTEEIKITGGEDFAKAIANARARVKEIDVIVDVESEVVE